MAGDGSEIDAKHEQRIRERTYQLWQADGSPVGKADRYWHRAQEIIERESGGLTTPPERQRAMATIIPFLPTDRNVFEPKDIEAMSVALDDVCKALNLKAGDPAREVMAGRIIDLARTGDRSPKHLSDRVLHEAGMAGRIGL